MPRSSGTSNAALASVHFFFSLFRKQLLGTQIRHSHMWVHTVPKTRTLVSPVMYVSFSPWAAVCSCTMYSDFKNMLHLRVQKTAGKFQVLQEHGKHKVGTDKQKLLKLI